MSQDLEGQVAIVTGGAGLVGTAVCRTFAAAGATVVIVDQEADKANNLINELGGKAVARIGTVLDDEWVKATVDDIASTYGRIDILINGVGGSRSGQIKDLSTEDWDFVINLNLKSAFLCARAVLPYMIERRHGRIISFGSGANHGTNGLGNYAAAKSGLVGLAQTITLEAAATGVTANVLILGLVYSERVTGQPSPLAERLLLQTPTGRLVRPEEIAGTALFLCGPYGGSITGEAIHLTGGMAWTGPTISLSRK